MAQHTLRSAHALKNHILSLFKTTTVSGTQQQYLLLLLIICRTIQNYLSICQSVKERTENSPIVVIYSRDDDR